MKIFVTGGTGFVGGHFINAVPNEIEIIAIKRKGSQPKILLNKDVHWLQKDLDEINEEDLKGADALVHFAAAGVSPQQATWEELYFWNVQTTLQLLKNSLKAGVGRVIVAGSYIEYGLSANNYDFIPTNAALFPTTPYASSKAAAFELVHAFCVEAKLPLFYNRIFSAYGKGQYAGNFWPSLRRAALAGEDFPMTLGEQIRDFIPVEKVAAAFVEDLKAATDKDFMPRVRNVCTGRGVSILEFAASWWAIWGGQGKLLPGAIPSRGNEPMRFVGFP